MLHFNPLLVLNLMPLRERSLPPMTNRRVTRFVFLSLLFFRLPIEILAVFLSSPSTPPLQLDFFHIFDLEPWNKDTHVAF